MLQARGHHEVGGHAAEVNAHVLIGFAIDDRGCPHVDVGVVEIGECLFPVRLLELEEDRAQGVGVVQRHVAAIRFDVSRRELGARRGCLEAATAKAAPPPAAGS